MQLDVRARALMLMEEIKCPHKGLDSGGLRCFLSRVWWCDNSFSNIRNLPPSKPELKKRRKKKDIKEGGLLGRVRAQRGFMRRTVARLPSDGAVRRFWKWSRNIAAVSGRKKCHCQGPHTVTCPERKGHQQWVILPRPPVLGSQAFTSAHSWNDRGAAGNQSDPGVASHMYVLAWAALHRTALSSTPLKSFPDFKHILKPYHLCKTLAHY